MADVDGLVVGGGPAGGMAAWMAAKNGASVIVVDRKTTIGEPVRCAEGTFSSLLASFGLADGPWVVNEYRQAIVKHKGSKDIIVRPKRIKGVSLDRVRFEQEIAKRAREEGVEFRMGKVVTGLQGSSIHLHDGSVIEGKIVLGTDGIESMVGRWAGLTRPLAPNDIAPAAQYVAEGEGWEADTVQMVLGSDVAPGGYLWVFPKSDRRANIGVITTAASGKRATDLLDRFVKENFPDITMIKRTGGCVPVARPIERAVKGPVALAGDSAHHASSFGAGGIHSALFSGAVVGRVAAKAAAKADPRVLEEYEDIWKKVLYKNLQRSYGLKTRAYGSEKGLRRTLRMARVGSAIISHLPVDPLGLWWGRLDKYV